jgi:methyl-accepting chemotaxis protein
VTLEEELKALMTPVRKNTTDLEAGLQELAELSQHVQVEMASQRDTLEGLLETMQKTISIEVCQPPLHASCSPLA